MSINGNSALKSRGNGPESDRKTGTPSKDDGLNASSKDIHQSLASIGNAAAHATFPSWMNVFLIMSLIFGGCCANVGKNSEWQDSCC